MGVNITFYNLAFKLQSAANKKSKNFTKVAG